MTAVFVPTGEIGRVMSKYKNAILRYNHRNYLGLSKNPVNKEIRNSISFLSHNDFALLNNGITILADETDYKSNPKVFEGKEVLVRVVVLNEQAQDSAANRHKFIESISTSTNQQTQIKETDRHSSNPLLANIQKEIFLKYGCFLELKRGEFYNGRSKGFINKAYLMDRTTMLRAFIAFSGQPTPARRHSEPQLYETKFFNNVSSERVTSNLALLVSEIFYAYRVHSLLVTRDKESGGKSLTYGYALRYGKYAVVYASSLAMNEAFRKDLHSRSLDEIDQYVNHSTPQILSMWKDFEDAVQKDQENASYFDPSQHLTDFDTYYKGTTLKANLENFFRRPNENSRSTSSGKLI